MVCYVEVKILPGAIFNFIMVKPVATCFYLKFDYSNVEDCVVFSFFFFMFSTESQKLKCGECGYDISAQISQLS